MNSALAVFRKRSNNWSTEIVGRFWVNPRFSWFWCSESNDEFLRGLELMWSIEIWSWSSGFVEPMKNY